MRVPMVADYNLDAFADLLDLCLPQSTN
jgi:hypothetical protein